MQRKIETVEPSSSPQQTKSDIQIFPTKLVTNGSRDAVIGIVRSDGSSVIVNIRYTQCTHIGEGILVSSLDHHLAGRRRGCNFTQPDSREVNRDSKRLIRWIIISFVGGSF